MHQNEREFPDVDTTLAIIDPVDFPESYELLSNVSADLADGIEADPFEVATSLIDSDMPGDLNEALIELIEELYLCAAARGNPEGWNDLGAQYYDGSRGFPQSFKKSVHYYELAAENGSRQAQENLGYCCYYGRNMPVDYERAFHYFALGAFDGHIVSLYKIGDMYLNGYYVQKNEKEAFHIFDHCIQVMTEEAAKYAAGPVFLRLGNCFLYGRGTEKDAKTALVCFQKAESFLYDMVSSGNVMYKKSLQGAIEGEEAARKELTAALSDKEWID